MMKADASRRSSGAPSRQEGLPQTQTPPAEGHDANPSLNNKKPTTAQDGPEKMHSQFALSFERLTVESLALPWHALEGIQESIHEKRRLVEQHSTVAMEHLRSIALLNAEVFALEKEFSAVMSTIVAERARTQEKLRALVQEWEHAQVSAASERSAETHQAHAAELQTARDEIKKLKKELKERERKLDVVVKERDDMHLVLKEYQLDATGPLLESIQARTRHASLTKKSSPPPQGAWAPHASARAQVSSFMDAAANRAQLEQSIESASARYGEQHLGNASSSSFVQSPQDDYRSEVVRLQGELAASRRESKMRKEEVDALRAAREDAHALGLTSGHQSFSQVHSSTASVAPSEHHHATSLFYSSNRSAASSGYPHNSSQTALQASRALLERQAQANGTSSGGAEQPVSLGLDLGTRRQQQGLAGVHVVDVAEGSPAAQAGMRPNDVVVAWGGRTVNRLEDIAHATRTLANGPPLATLDIKFLRPTDSDGAQDGSGSTAFSVPTDDEILTAILPLGGRLEGPFNSRRESFHTMRSTS